MALLGLVITLAAGIALGMFGGGGSLLMVPTLVYFFDLSPLEATTYSLLVVGAVSAVGALVRRSRTKLPVRRVAVFGVLSIAAAYATRALLVPGLPPVIEAGPLAVERDLLLMLLFSVFAGTAGVMMLRQRCCSSGPAMSPRWVPLAAVATGTLTGLLGVGGAFLILPALVLLVGLDMDEAVGASLALVSAQSVAGAAGAIGAAASLNLPLILTLILLMLSGLAVGMSFAHRVAPERLRRAFGALTLAVAVATAVQQLA